MLTAFKKGVFDGLGPADEQAAIKPVLFLGDPVAPAVLADEYEGKRSRAARGRFSEFHFSGPSNYRAVPL
jgi:hypothetical protein